MSARVEVLPNSFPNEPKENWDLGPDWFHLFCASCGTPGGSARKTDIPNHEQYAFYLCPSCADKYGDLPPDLYMIPDEVFFQKIQEAQIEKYGRILEESELVVQLDDSTSFISGFIKGEK